MVPVLFTCCEPSSSSSSSSAPRGPSLSCTSSLTSALSPHADPGHLPWARRVSSFLDQPCGQAVAGSWLRPARRKGLCFRFDAACQQHPAGRVSPHQPAEQGHSMTSCLSAWLFHLDLCFNKKEPTLKQLCNNNYKDLDPSGAVLKGPGSEVRKNRIRILALPCESLLGLHLHP